jgi:hypothetical protein
MPKKLLASALDDRMLDLDDDRLLARWRNGSSLA